ncbi:MAG: hypothetical protein AAF515_11765 [Pseudomonadota bacterium]
MSTQPATVAVTSKETVAEFAPTVAIATTVLDAAGALLKVRVPSVQFPLTSRTAIVPGWLTLEI